MDIVEYGIEREKCLRELEEAELREIENAWNGLTDLYEQSKELNEKRAEMLGELYCLSYGHIEVHYANISETFRTQITGFDAQKARIYPIVHYRILPNELVFDIDADDPDKAKEQLDILLYTIEQLGVTPLVGHSGNRGYHAHLLIAPPNGPNESFITNPTTIQLRNVFWRWLLSHAKVYGLDIKLIDFSIIQSQNHTIRAFYSFNPKGKNWKLPVKGSSYSDAVYVMPKDMALTLLNQMATLSSTRAVDDFAKSEVRKINWIEAVLRHPERVKDGRKRILYHLLIPYLITVKRMKPDDAMKRLIEWLEQTSADFRKYRSWLRSNVKLTAKKQIKPMSYQRFITCYPELAKYIGGYE
jgi:hypothetical protein